MNLAKPPRLTVEELLILESFAKSQAYSAFRKLVSARKQELLFMLAQEENEPKIRQLQGRILGLSELENWPQIMAAESERIRSDPRAKLTPSNL